MLPADALREGDRLMTICNSCRYCEGYCAVFPAMEQRVAFPDTDLRYLANLCHNCAECYYACQYAPPHEFAVNVPQILAQIRRDSHEHYAWPQPVARAARKRAWALPGVAVCLALLAFVVTTGGREVLPAANFYSVVPHGAMVALFGAAGAFVALAWLVGFMRFWKESGESFAALARPATLTAALRDVLKLEYLRSGGAGCTYPDEHHSMARRRFHHLTFYGFMLCFAATSIAAVYDNLFGWQAPYSWFSLPVALGVAGGLGLLTGPPGLLFLKLRRDKAIVDGSQDGLDLSFIGLLFMTALTGFLLLLMRETHWMGSLLCVHLAVVFGLFITLPYGKFVHGIYRSAALLRYALERSRIH